MSARKASLDGGEANVEQLCSYHVCRGTDSSLWKSVKVTCQVQMYITLLSVL